LKALLRNCLRSMTDPLAQTRWKAIAAERMRACIPKTPIQYAQDLLSEIEMSLWGTKLYKDVAKLKEEANMKGFEAFKLFHAVYRREDGVARYEETDESNGEGVMEKLLATLRHLASMKTGMQCMNEMAVVAAARVKKAPDKVTKMITKKGQYSESTEEREPGDEEEKVPPNKKSKKAQEEDDDEVEEQPKKVNFIRRQEIPKNQSTDASMMMDAMSKMQENMMKLITQKMLEVQEGVKGTKDAVEQQKVVTPDPPVQTQAQTGAAQGEYQGYTSHWRGGRGGRGRTNWRGRGNGNWRGRRNQGWHDNYQNNDWGDERKWTGANTVSLGPQRPFQPLRIEAQQQQQQQQPYVANPVTVAPVVEQQNVARTMCKFTPCLDPACTRMHQNGQHKPNKEEHELRRLFGSTRRCRRDHTTKTCVGCDRIHGKSNDTGVRCEKASKGCCEQFYALPNGCPYNHRLA
jgi:hypothetical protein